MKLLTSKRKMAQREIALGIWEFPETLFKTSKDVAISRRVFSEKQRKITKITHDSLKKDCEYLGR